MYINQDIIKDLFNTKPNALPVEAVIEMVMKETNLSYHDVLAILNGENINFYP